jgi:DNA-directed RNA polymerase specialized sigma24 family protein
VNPEDLLCAVLAARLTPMQSDVLLDVTLLDATHAELALKYGVSRSRIGQVLQRAREKVYGAFLAAA